MRRCLSIFLLALSAGCATSSRLFVTDFVVTDNPAEQRFDLEFRNDLGRTVCLLPEFWPNRGGKIDHGADLVSLLVDGKRFALEDFNTGYCPGCSTAVAPGDSNTTFLTYADFGLPEDLRYGDKALVYELKVFFCRH